MKERTWPSFGTVLNSETLHPVTLGSQISAVTKSRILLVDDNESFLRQFAPIVTACGDYDVIPLNSAADALNLLHDERADLIVSDVQMPGMSGMEFFREVQELHPDIPVIFITAFSCVEDAVRVVKQGAFHYFEKPVVDKLELFQATLREALAKRRILRELGRLHREKSLQSSKPEAFIGESEGIKKILQSIDDVAHLPVTVLICGETGTGKDVVARAIHESGDRRSSAFLPVNCGEFSEGILESELFGHERGAFTGAIDRRKGIFEIADQGTLFLDEISEASPRLQTKLLRVLETKTFMRVGGSVPLRSDFRLLAATNRNLPEAVESGKFRQDLLYRLNVYAIEIPPLRERKDDIPLLVEFYLAKFKKSYHRPIEGISDEAMLLLREYHWPGNVRELVNIMERAVITCRENLITSRHLPFHSGNGELTGLPNLSLKDAERFVISLALKRSHGNKVQAAALLGINRKTLLEKMKTYGLYEAKED